MSTIAEVKSAIITQFQSIKASLDFNSNNAFKDYLIEYHTEGEPGSYLYNEIVSLSNEKIARVVCLDVTRSNTLFFDTVGNSETEFRILVRQLYEKQNAGAGHQAIVAHAELLAEGIKNMGTNLSNTVDSCEQDGSIEINLVPAPDEIPRNELIQADQVFVARQVPATFS